MNPNLTSRRTLTLPAPRLLPIVIGTMTVLMVLKVGSVVHATAVGHAAEVPQARHETATVQSPARPVMLANNAPPATAPVASGSAKPEAGGISPDVRAKAPEPLAPSVPGAGAEPPISDSERALLTDLRQRRQKLDEREATLATREAALGAVEKRLAARVDELTAMQQQLQGLEKQRQERDEANWRGLVKLYETMKPREAAAIFNDLDLPVLLPVMDRMKEAKAAAIISVMQPERARQLTVELANQRIRSNSIAAPDPARKPQAAATSG
jgi:flagellar motility protein MotE (MotC chaperone)